MIGYQKFPAWVLTAICAIGALHAPEARAKSPSVEEQAVLATVHALFDGLAHRDRAAILAALLPGGSATLGLRPLEVSAKLA